MTIMTTDAITIALTLSLLTNFSKWGSRNSPPIVIIPSPLILARTYKELAALLSPHFQVLIPDLPGTGSTSGEGKSWKTEDYSEWIKTFMDTLHISKSVILGHSNSGPIALKLALAHPDKVLAIILADSTGLAKFSYLRLLTGRFIDLFYELKFSFFAGLHLFSNVLFHPLNFSRQLQISVKENYHEEFLRLKSPVLFLWGAKDRTVPLKLVQELESSLGNAHLYVFPKGSHDWILTNPKEAGEVIISYILGQRKVGDRLTDEEQTKLFN
ncbi:MAG: alpha/beta fold hydrolase [Bacteriovoracia bacterium]